MAQCCTFYLGGRIFGLDILRIQEIIHLHEVTPVPGSPEFVEGLANLRGQIVVAVNLRKIFGMPAAPAGSGSVHIILPREDEVLSLIADSAGDVHDFGDEPMVPPPNPGSGPAGQSPGSDLIQGVFKLKDSLLHVIDPAPLFADWTAAGPKLFRQT